MCDSKGAIYERRPNGMNGIKERVSKFTNKNKETGTLGTVLEGADVFIGVSVGGILTEEMVKKMNEDPIVFAMANPDTEILHQDAMAAGVKIIGTSISDYRIQVHNDLSF